MASGGLKNSYPGCLCEAEEQARVEALLATCHPSNLVPSSTTLMQRQSIKSKQMDDTAGEKESVFCFILSGF